VKSIFLCLVACLAVLPHAAIGQDAGPSRTTKSKVVFLTLASPKYPPLARQANITGEVQIKLKIHKDGSIASADAMSGHPMLTPAALDSAKQSRFECRRCEDDETEYIVVYSFQIAASPGWPCPEGGGAPRISQLENRVTLTVEPRMISIYFAGIRVRSAKCLYLWRCSSHWGGYDYYYYKIRSPKCLDLWHCGYALREPFATCRKLQRTVLD
jgi:TonB family protein